MAAVHHLEYITYFLFFSMFMVSGILVDPIIQCRDPQGNTNDGPCAVSESDGSVFLEITTRTQQADEIINSLAVTTDMDATSGADYLPIRQALAHSSTRGLLTYIVEIKIVDDEEVEGTEEFTVNVVPLGLDGNRVACPETGPSNCMILIQITDDDGITISLDKERININEGSSSTVNVVRGNDLVAGDVNVDLMLRHVSAESGDYTISSSSIAIGSGAMVPITIEGLTDGDIEGTEVFEIILTNPSISSGETVVVDKDTVVVSIADPLGDVPSYWIEHPAYTAYEAITPFTFNIKRSTPGTVETISFSTRDVSTTAGLDYQAVVNQQVTFATTSDTAEGQVNILSDASTEGPEMFEISIANPSNGVIGAIQRAPVTLYDVTASESRYYLDRFSYAIMESSPQLSVTVHREGDVSQAGSVVLESSNGKAVSPNDYGRVEETISFSANEVEREIYIQIIDDKILESPEIFQLTLSQPQGGVVGNPGGASVTIEDNDYCFALDSGAYSGHESDNPLNVYVTKHGYTGDSSTSVRVYTTAGTAAANSDFSSINQVLTFSMDITAMHVPGLILTQDGEYENTEQFAISISTDDQSNVCNPSTATISIESSDALCDPPCNNQGICSSKDTCACQSGFTGPTCDETECTDPCVNDGVCVGPNTCVCQTGYEGPTCAEVRCPTSYCVNGGTCLITSSAFYCVCDDGYTGDQCDSEVARATLSTGGVVGISVGAAVLLILLIVGTVIFFCVVMYNRRTKNSGQPPRQSQSQIPLQQQLQNPGFNNAALLMDGNNMTFDYQPSNLALGY